MTTPNEKSHTLRRAGGKVWNDPTLAEWDDNDYRIFCGDLGNEVTDDTLSQAFRHFKSFLRARVVRDSRTAKSKGYGFVSFSDPRDMLVALKTMNRHYVGNRPIRVMKSKWKERNPDHPKNQAIAAAISGATVADQSKTLRKFKKVKKTNPKNTAPETPQSKEGALNINSSPQ